MPELRVTLKSAVQQLKNAGIESAHLDAEILLAESLRISRSDLLLGRAAQEITPEQLDLFSAFISRRTRHEPIAYIIGHKEFWSLEFKVGPGALIPRPDSEVLIETALELYAKSPPASILDLGTGPGTLLLSALTEFKKAHGLGIDASDLALTYARDNATRFGLEARAQFHLGNWAQSINAQFDLILCNPPYISTADILMPDVQNFEPSTALFAGSDGMDDYRAIVPDLARLMTPTGIAVFELGHTQAELFSALARENGFQSVFRHDLSGHKRCAIMTIAQI
jgi:release factor glutamine methyltransferase